MSEFYLLEKKELENFNGGGVVSLAAGAVAGAMIGTIVSLPYAAITEDPSVIAKGAIAGGSAGAYVGAGCPLP